MQRSKKDHMFEPCLEVENNQKTRKHPYIGTPCYSFYLICAIVKRKFHAREDFVLLKPGHGNF